MRIIEQHCKEAEYIRLCKKCGCKFGFFEVDTILHSHKDIDGYSDNYYVVKCPSCSTDIRLHGNWKSKQ
ncbi:hypothetical protein UFOVP273_98 [uncultured Caudovirales phage]|uniref:Uncharacterized protein n=1 Tax=uncultured Caudovirales phage TaxID=2100421 RepID=A0A6J5LRY4_9CAUD|nr:hypothetical protein UFOVP273_98 [uncultured Caudovirales phage]